MPRLLSVSHTEQAVIDRRKTVTRRLGWRKLTEGTRLTLCRKVMGRRRDEPLVRLAEVEVVNVHRERLWHITDEDILREGVAGDHWLETYTEHDNPAMIGQPTPGAWVAWFAEVMGCNPEDYVTVIEWRYLDGQ